MIRTLHLSSHPVATLPRRAAAVRLALALAFIFGIVLLPRDAWAAHGGAAILLLGTSLACRVPLGTWLRRVLWLEPFAASVAALALFQPGGAPLFFMLLTKSSLCIACMLLLSLVVPFQQTLTVLRQWGVPALLVTTLALAQRYLSVLIDEVHRMHRARQSRTLTPHRSVWWGLLSGIVALLFIRSIGRAERIHAAMCARGWKP